MRLLAIDTETYWDIEKGRNIPFVMTVCGLDLKPKLFDLRIRKEFREAKRLVEKLDIAIFHNAAYDIGCLRNVGIAIKAKIEDTMAQANIINENFESKGLKGLAKKYLREPCKEEAALKSEIKQIKKELKKAGKWQEWWGKDLPYNMIPMPILSKYAMKDAYYTIRLWQLFNKSIHKYQDVYDLEISIIPAIVDMIDYGMRLDREFCFKMWRKYTKETKEIEEELVKILRKEKINFSKEKDYKRYPRKAEDWDSITENEDGTFHAVKEIPLNPGSKQQIAKVLTKLGVDTGKYGKTGMSVDKDSLAPFKHIPFIAAYSRYQFLIKQTGTYYGPLYTWYTSKKHDRCHFGLYQTGAKSGRFSAELIQTIPKIGEEKQEADQKLIRFAFIPEDGYYFSCIDYDQIEMRIFADFSKCQPLIDGINAGMDPHDSTTLTLFGKKARKYQQKIKELENAIAECKKVKKAEDLKKEHKKIKAMFKALRSIAKTINFGIIYGMGQNKLALRLGLALIEAREILDTYYRRYPVKQFLKETTSELYRTGSVKVLIDRPRCKLYREYRVPQELAYKAVNILIQGTAAYMMKLGMKRVYDFIKKNKLDIRLILTVHDELIFEINKKYKPEDIIPELVECMNDETSLKVPIIASPKVSYKSWGDAKDWKMAA